MPMESINWSRLLKHNSTRGNWLFCEFKLTGKFAVSFTSDRETPVFGKKNMSLEITGITQLSLVMTYSDPLRPRNNVFYTKQNL